MAGDADTYLADTSTGEVSVHYGWESWVVVHRKGSADQRAVVRNRRALERLLVDAGVPGIEAKSLAPGLWKSRPKGAHREGVDDAWEDPWKRHGTVTLVMFLVGLVVIVAAHVVFHVDWVGYR
jgi:coenzyme F420-reducing hydrogenase beta subunit